MINNEDIAKDKSSVLRGIQADFIFYAQVIIGRHVNWQQKPLGSTMQNIANLILILYTEL